MLVAVSNPQALWYTTRGFGVVTMILLTASVVLGVSQIVRVSAPGVPRFVLSGLHRNVSLLSLVFLAVHIVTAVADPFAPIAVADVFIPFVGTYRPLWLGLGALATDMLGVLIVTSLLRVRMGYRVWRAVHWCAYACWPFAVVHGLGTGSDSRLGWVQFVYAVCFLSVLAALAWRLGTRWSGAPYTRRLTAGVGALLATTLIGTWALQGPFRSGWARRAGTPPSLLGGRGAPVGPSSPRTGEGG